MAAIQSGADPTKLMTVDPTFLAGRQTLRPQEVLGWYSVGVQSGLMTGVVAGGAIFSLRNIGTNLLIVRRVGISFICTTAFTAAQRMDFGLIAARTFSASDSGGTAIALTGNNTKSRTSLAAPTNLDLRIATTAALTAGTKTLDTNNLSQVGGWIGAIGATIGPSNNNLVQHDAGDYPIVLANNEGINIQNLTLMGATGVGIAYVNLEFAEATAF